MTNSESIPLAQVHALMDFVGELDQFPAGTRAWREHVVGHIHTVIPCHSVQLPEMLQLLPGVEPTMVAADSHGWISAEARRSFFEWAASGEAPQSDPMIHRLAAFRQPTFAYRRAELIEDAEWRGSKVVEVLRETNEADDMMCAVARLNSEGWAFGLGLQRAVGDRGFSARERNVLALLNEHLARALRRALVPRVNHQALSPRLRQTLEGLLAGLGDKQLANELGISRHTVREYVKELYKRFGVSGRHELVVTCLAGPVPGLAQ